MVYSVDMLHVYVLYSEWSSLEKEMGDGLQKSGHYMDRLGADSFSQCLKTTS